MMIVSRFIQEQGLIDYRRLLQSGRPLLEVQQVRRQLGNYCDHRGEVREREGGGGGLL